MNSSFQTLLVLFVTILGSAASNADDRQFALTDAQQKWYGTIDAGLVKLRIVVEAEKAEDGTFAAKMLSLDQGNSEIQVEKFEFDGGKLIFSAPKVAGSSTGTLDESQTIATGTWTQMGQEIPLELQRVSEVPTSTVKEAWKGTLDAGVAQLELQFRVLEGEGGTEEVVFDSLSERQTGLAAKMESDGDSVTFSVPIAKITVEGKYNEDKSEIIGTWTQGGNTMPFTMKRLEEAAKPASSATRPQHPKQPYPYESAEVAFDNTSAGITLAGTLTWPKGNGPFPAVALVTGSGPQDRDETLMGHKPFLVIADYLTRQGIAVLRYDDRGVGNSEGEFATATSVDFADDAAAAITFLKRDSRCDPQRLGVIGHSEGGLIAGMLAAKNADLAHVVLLSGPGIPGHEIITSQTRAIYEALQLATPDDPVSLDERLQSLETVLNAIVADVDATALDTVIEEFVAVSATNADKDAQSAAEAMVKSQAALFRTDWFRYFLKYDPFKDLSNAKCAVLALNGSKDLQVLVDLNLPRIEAALQQSGIKDFKCIRLEGLNHLFQEAQTGAPNEYGAIDETFSPKALAMISKWVLAH